MRYSLLVTIMVGILVFGCGRAKVDIRKPEDTTMDCASILHQMATVKIEQEKIEDTTGTAVGNVILGVFLFPAMMANEMDADEAQARLDIRYSVLNELNKDKDCAITTQMVQDKVSSIKEKKRLSEMEERTNSSLTAKPAKSSE